MTKEYDAELNKNLEADLNDICEECNNDSPTVIQNLMMHSYKICDSCKLSKTIFPI